VTIVTNVDRAAEIGVLWLVVLALRPESHLSPNATDGAICATRREAAVTGFDCGAW
jgi:hypothetical protein